MSRIHLPTLRRPKITRARLALLGVLVVLAVAAALALRPESLVVDTALAARQPLRVTVDAEGKVRVRERYVIAAPVTGRLQRLELREGASVRAGDVVARLAPLPLDATTAAQATARLSASEALAREVSAHVRQARDLLDQAERAARRTRRLADAGAVAEAQREDAERTLRMQQEEHAAALERARAATADVRAGRAALLGAGTGGAVGAALVEVRAPSAGRVLRVPERSERVVAAGTPLLELGDGRTLEIVADVLSTDAVRVCAGAEVVVDGWGGDAPLVGWVREVEPSAFTRLSALGVDEQRVNVLIDVPSPPETLGDGYRVDAHVIVWEERDVLVVPPSAVFQAGDETRLFVVADGRARLRTVRLGERGDAAVQVVDGLAAGERVVLFPPDDVRDGTRVRAR